MEDLNVIICGNGFDNNGLAHFNLRVRLFMSSTTMQWNKKKK
jgi:hypothetical protein